MPGSGGSAAADSTHSAYDRDSLTLGQLKEQLGNIRAHNMPIDRMAAYAVAMPGLRVKKPANADTLLVGMVFQQQYIEALLRGLPTVSLGTQNGYHKALKRIVRHLASRQYIDSSTAEQFTALVSEAAAAAVPPPVPVQFATIREAAAAYEESADPPTYISKKTTPLKRHDVTYVVKVTASGKFVMSKYAGARVRTMLVRDLNGVQSLWGLSWCLLL